MTNSNKYFLGLLLIAVGGAITANQIANNTANECCEDCFGDCLVISQNTQNNKNNQQKTNVQVPCNDVVGMYFFNFFNFKIFPIGKHSVGNLSDCINTIRIQNIINVLVIGWIVVLGFIIVHFG